jgi:hypothetical protein
MSSKIADFNSLKKKMSKKRLPYLTVCDLCDESGIGREPLACRVFTSFYSSLGSLHSLILLYMYELSIMSFTLCYGTPQTEPSPGQ